jgi:acetyltransferase-like isoleucine patch superfamily enzyme
MLIKVIWVFRAFIYKAIFAKVGTLSYLGRPLFVTGGKKVFLGKKVRIYPHFRIEVLDDGIVDIHNDVSIGQCLHLISKDSKLVIGQGSVISANVLITNIDHSYAIVNVSIHKQPLTSNKTEIGANCFIGYGAVIQAGTILGDGCIVGANAVVRGHFAPHSVIVGVPAKAVKVFNQETQEWEKVR